jgi:hypothetical protein
MEQMSEAPAISFPFCCYARLRCQPLHETAAAQGAATRQLPHGKPPAAKVLRVLSAAPLPAQPTIAFSRLMTFIFRLQSSELY